MKFLAMEINGTGASGAACLVGRGMLWPLAEQNSTSVPGIEELRGAVGRVKHGKAGDMQGFMKHPETSRNIQKHPETSRNIRHLLTPVQSVQMSQYPTMRGTSRGA